MGRFKDYDEISSLNYQVTLDAVCRTLRVYNKHKRRFKINLQLSPQGLNTLHTFKKKIMDLFSPLKSCQPFAFVGIVCRSDCDNATQTWNLSRTHEHYPCIILHPWGKIKF